MLRLTTVYKDSRLHRTRSLLSTAPLLILNRRQRITMLSRPPAPLPSVQKLLHGKQKLQLSRLNLLLLLLPVRKASVVNTSRARAISRTSSEGRRRYSVTPEPVNRGLMTTPSKRVAVTMATKLGPTKMGIQRVIMARMRVPPWAGRSRRLPTSEQDSTGIPLSEKRSRRAWPF